MMDAKIEIAQTNNQALSNSVVGDVLIYATSNVQSVLVGQSNSLPALRCLGANVTAGADLTVQGNINVMGSILQSNSVVNTNVPSGTAIVSCQRSVVGYDYALLNGATVSMSNSTWSQRVLNTISVNIGSNVDSVTNNRMWLKPGTYVIDWDSPIGFYNGSSGANQIPFKSRLRNATTGTDVAYSKSGCGTWVTNTWVTLPCGGSCVCTVAGASNAFEIWQAYQNVPAGTIVAPYNSGNLMSTPDTLTQIKITRIG
jgi:hypothetical protein